MKEKSTYITKEGLKKLKKELDDLKNVKRKEISLRIQEAKELGDLSENAEYAEAKNEQAFIEGRISELENILRNVIIIDTRKRKTNIIGLGSTIRVKTDDKELDLTIVGSNEVNPNDGKISNESPLGRSFIGKKLDDTVIIDVPNGTKKYIIIAIN